MIFLNVSSGNVRAAAARGDCPHDDDRQSFRILLGFQLLVRALDDETQLRLRRLVSGSCSCSCCFFVQVPSFFALNSIFD